MSYGSYGFTLQKLICEEFGILPCGEAQIQFDKQFNKKYENNAKNKIKKIFKKIKEKPVKCVTYDKDIDGNLYDYNFVLESGKTLDIKSNINSKRKVTVNKLGQPGYDVINQYFSQIYGKNIVCKNDIKLLFLKHISEIIPIYVRQIFKADYTVFVGKSDRKVIVINSSDIDIIDFESEKFAFTSNKIRNCKNGKKWNVSTTVKYDEISIAEIELEWENQKGC